MVIGHSQCRTIFQETDEGVANKTVYAISKDLSVITCIGELLEEREAGKTVQVNEPFSHKFRTQSRIVIFCRRYRRFHTPVCKVHKILMEIIKNGSRPGQSPTLGAVHRATSVIIFYVLQFYSHTEATVLPALACVILA